MKIVVAVRCYNESRNIERFMRGYDFADTIVVSDGGSTDDSVSILKRYSKIHILNFDQQETVGGETWNPDAPHMNFVLDAAKALEPDWIIFDDMDCCPNRDLNQIAQGFFSIIDDRHIQVNAFRLYLWGDTQYFPKMNDNFNPAYTSLWAWRPDKIDIHADVEVKHGTLVGLSSTPYKLELPYVLLHKSWHPDTIQQKIDRYNALGLPMTHPLEFAGTPEELPSWAKE